jgi:hypothetical protein
MRAIPILISPVLYSTNYPSALPQTIRAPVRLRRRM